MPSPTTQKSGPDTEATRLRPRHSTSMTNCFTSKDVHSPNSSGVCKICVEYSLLNGSGWVHRQPSTLTFITIVYGALFLSGKVANIACVQTAPTLFCLFPEGAQKPVPRPASGCWALLRGESGDIFPGFRDQTKQSTV